MRLPYHASTLTRDIAGGLFDLRIEGGCETALCDIMVVLWDGEKRLTSFELTDAMEALTDGAPVTLVDVWDNATAATVEPRPKWQRAATRRKYQ